jgi:hypothetical protein
MKTNSIKSRLDSSAGAGLLVFAQILVLAALLLGLQFILRTTGGSLFLAASLAPALTILAVVISAALLLYRYTRRHSLFLKEQYAPGEDVFKKGDNPDCAYFVVSGEAEVIREQDGRESVVAVLTPGEYFGEMALLSNEPRNATVRAKTPLVTEVIGKDNFLAMMRAVRSAREDVTKTMEQRLSRAARGGSSSQ